MVIKWNGFSLFSLVSVDLPNVTQQRTETPHHDKLLLLSIVHTADRKRYFGGKNWTIVECRALAEAPGEIIDIFWKLYLNVV